MLELQAPSMSIADQVDRFDQFSAIRARRSIHRELGSALSMERAHTDGQRVHASASRTAR